MQIFEFSSNDTIKLLTREPLFTVRLSILQPGLLTNTMRPVKDKIYQGQTLELRTQLELEYDDLVHLNMECLYDCTSLVNSCEGFPILHYEEAPS
jgi:hypothetical protein